MLTIDRLIEKGVATFFPTPMSFFENKNLLSGIKKEILSREVEGIESGVAKNIKHNLTESNFEFLDKDLHILNDMKAWIYECLKKTINSIQQEKVDYKTSMAGSWYHITKTNGLHEPHYHANCSWCGIYYVQAGDDDDSGDTVFRSPIQSSYIDSGSKYLDIMSNLRIKPRDGMLVLFPSFLTHYQALYKGSEDRIVIVFNICVENLGEN